MDDPTEGKRDRYPMPGVCVDCRRFQPAVFRFGPADRPSFLCRSHLVGRIKRGTWPDTPRNLMGGD